MSAVEQRHIDFARAVVKLAREHRMDGLALSFHDSFSTRNAGGREQMNMTWAEGRHGDTNRILIRCEAHTSFDERPEYTCRSTTADGRSCREWCGDAKCAAGAPVPTGQVLPPSFPDEGKQTV